MNDNLALILAFLSGVLLGSFFFGGLWWTVRKGLTSEWAAAWFLGSLLLRTGVVLVGFFVSRGDWLKLSTCLLGFIMARVIIMQHVKRAIADERSPLEMEADRAH